MKALFTCGFVLLFLFIVGCSREKPMQPVTTPNSAMEVRNVGHELDELSNSVLGHESTVVVPAGSQDALSDAIAQAGPNGTVLLKTGQHDESGRVDITIPVKLKGEPGAVLVIDTQSSSANVLNPGLYVHNTSDVEILGLEIRPKASEGGVAIMLDNAPNVVVDNNKIYDHQFGVLLQNSDKSLISGNKIVGTSSWKTGALAAVGGIFLINGDNVIMKRNEVTSCVYGLFASNYKGQMINNKASGNQIGFVLCKVQPWFTAPGGALIGSVNAASQWKMMHNESSNNLYVGYLVIDGANNNYIANNAGSGNGVYDIELTGDTSKFGFFTPKTFENIAITGDLLTKDCGENNKVRSSNLVDNSLDPCL